MSEYSREQPVQLDAHAVGVAEGQTLRVSHFINYSLRFGDDLHAAFVALRPWRRSVGDTCVDEFADQRR